MITVEDLSKACANSGAAYTVYFTEDGHSMYPIRELVVIGEKAVLFAHYDEKEGQP